MRVLITGGRGFLGRAVVKELAGHGHHPLVLSRSTNSDIRADLCDRDGLIASLAHHDFDAVCHLAALTSARDSFADPVGYFDTNVCGTVNLLRALTAPVRVVFTSTSTVYGSVHTGRLREDLPPDPRNPYAASKLAAEQLLAYAPNDAVILRCFNMAGAIDGYADPDPTRIITAALNAAAGRIPHVTINGDGSAIREFTHVLDVARAVRLALETPDAKGHLTLNIGTGEGHSMLEVVRAAEKATERRIEVVHRDAAVEAHTLVCDPARARETLGWLPTASGLDRILTDAWAAHPKDSA